MPKRSLLFVSAAFTLAALGQAPAFAYELNDSHLHVTNYIQEGLTLSQFLTTMGDKTWRAAVFGIPLQQKWDYFESADRAPEYYLLADAELYYYSFIDAVI